MGRDEQRDRDPTGLVARLRAARTEPWKVALPPSMLELHWAAPDPMAVLLRVIGGSDVPVLNTSEDAEQPVKRTRKRKPDFVKQVKRAQAAGLQRQIGHRHGGQVAVTFGEPMRLPMGR